MNTRPTLAQIVENIAPVLAEHAAEHDAENRFVEGNYRLLREQGFFGALVPTALGGLGASHGDVADAIRQMARSCPATALAASMHTHLLAAVVFRFLKGQGGEPLLRRVAAEQLVLVSTGAGDWFESNGTLEAVPGGYRFTAKKAFCSGCLAGNLLVTSSVLEDPKEGAQVLHFAVPLSAPGISIGTDWDTLGMRGTGSHTVRIEGVFVPSESVTVRRPRAGWHPAWSVALTLAPAIYMAPYLGAAETARERAVEACRGARAETPVLIGEMDNALMLARLAWKHLVENAAGFDFTPTVERANSAMIGKTLMTNALVATVDKAMELVGGAAYFRKAGIERLFRDVRGAPNHPMPEKRQQILTGRLALGLDPLTG